MRQIYKYIWLLIVLSAVATVMPILRDAYLARTYGATEVPDLVKANIQMLTVAFVALQNLVSALWLRHVARSAKEETLVWMAFGLFFGLFAVIIFYLVSLNERRDT